MADDNLDLSSCEATSEVQNILQGTGQTTKLITASTPAATVGAQSTSDEDAAACGVIGDIDVPCIETGKQLLDMVLGDFD